ncbi:MAG TPA: NAD-dependent epimerase/dehydratase family protein [Anaerohalosphaeraceae bacterium]|nr:NAD-dependent epimerase/dehydratase family protein [Anaerohalosphaeraceae bacterium]
MNQIKRIGITGLAGFMGTHLKDRLSREKEMEVLPFEDSFFDNPDVFIDFAKKADVIVHLAGVNRDQPEVIYRKNIELMEKLLHYVDVSGNKPYILFSSSTQIERDNEYGRGKKKAMELLQQWSQKNNTPAVSMVVPNVFGDGGRPFYNSVVATFCYQVTHSQEPKIDKDGRMTMIYINDLVEDIYRLIQSPPAQYQVEYIKPRAEVQVSEILALLNKFKDFYYGSGMVPAIKSGFERDLYNTFITYMDAADWERHLKRNTDERGSFVEVFKLENGGQVSFSTTRPGITRGNHYHIRKNEKFCVVSGQASIKLRRIGTDKVIEFKVSGEAPSWVEMPIYHTHNITNIGESELVTLFWINEHFNPDDPDTFFEKV